MKKKRGVKVKRKSKRKRKASLFVLILAFIVGAVFFYFSTHFGNIIGSRITSLYAESEMAKYYDLSFSKVRVNLFNMSVKVFNLQLTPKLETQSTFFNENGSLDIQVDKALIYGADIFTFIASNNIDVGQFKIRKARINVHKSTQAFQPFSFIKKNTAPDSLSIRIKVDKISITQAQLSYFSPEKKKAINSFNDFNIEIDSVLIVDKLNQFNLSFYELNSNLSNIKYRGKNKLLVSLGKFEMALNEFQLHVSQSKFDLNYKDFSFYLSKPSVTTEDSVYTFSAQKIKIDKSTKELIINKASLHPNLSKIEFVRHYSYQKLWADIQLNNIRLTNIDFGRIVNNEGVFSDSLIINNVQADLYKSKKRPLNRNRFPHYLAKQILNIKYPLRIKTTKISNLNIDFSITQEDGRLSKISINDLNGFMKNVQNDKPNQKLQLSAKGKVEHSIPFFVKLVFTYGYDSFTYTGAVFKSKLSSISESISSFAPVEIDGGEIMDLKFRGKATSQYSSGSMKFLYRNLDLDVKTGNNKKFSFFQNQFLSLAANTYIYSNNPVNASAPIRKVHYNLKRDRNKGFIHLLVQSILEGVKETIAPSSENRRKYKKEKKKRKKAKNL